MRIFKVKAFERCAREEKIADRVLRKAVQEIRDGLVDARLGGGIYKKRIPASSRGKRGGARTIVAFHAEHHTFFMFMFLKNERENIGRKELKALRQFSQYLLKLDDDKISEMIKNNDLFEIQGNG